MRRGRFCPLLQGHGNGFAIFKADDNPCQLAAAVSGFKAATGAGDFGCRAKAAGVGALCLVLFAKQIGAADHPAVGGNADIR